MSQLETAVASTLTDEAEVDLARRIQSAFVPAQCFGWPGTSIAARRVAGSALGGDFHNAIRGLDDKCIVVVGTVAGPGLHAALVKAVLSGAARKLGPICPSPGTLVSQLSRLLDRTNAGLREPSMTCSLFVGQVDRAAGTLEYCNAGSCGSLALMAEGTLCDLRPTGPALGTSSGHGCTSESVEFSSLQRLIVHTEGFVAARSPLGEPFGVNQRRLFGDTMHLPVEEQVDAVTQTLRDHVGPDCNLAADATVLVTEFSEAVPVPGGDSMKSWLENHDRSVGAVPDPSVFLG